MKKKTNNKTAYLLLFIFLSSVSTFAVAQFNIYNGSDGKDLNLTDEERNKSRDYLNKGLEQTILQDQCKGLERECQGLAAKRKTFGLPNETIELASKAYSTIMGMTSGDLPTKDGGKRSDHCSRLPFVGEMMSGFIQQSEQKNLQNLPAIMETEQKNALYKASRNHSVRSTTSTIQATSYGAATACYAGMVLAGNVNPQAVALKLPATALLSAFYVKNAIAQKDMSKKVQGIADALPGKGDCNPITQKRCFCNNFAKIEIIKKKWAQEDAEKLKEAQAHNEEVFNQDLLANLKSFAGFGDSFKTTTPRTVQQDIESYQKYCAPNLHNNRLSNAQSKRVICLDSRGRPDAFCDCAKVNSCMDKQFITKLKSIGRHPTTEAALQDMSSLVRGELRNGDLRDGEIGSFATAKRYLRKIGEQLTSPENLNDSQKKEAMLAEQFLGIPKKLSAHLASSQIPSSAYKNALQKFQNAASGINLDRMSYNGGNHRDSSNNLDLIYSGGKKRGGLRDQASVKEEAVNNVTNSVVDSDLYKFAQKAQIAAEIDKRKHADIFQMISSRYNKVNGRGDLIESFVP